MRANIFGWLGILFTSLLGWQTFSDCALFGVWLGHTIGFTFNTAGWSFWGWFGVLGVGCW